MHEELRISILTSVILDIMVSLRV